MKRFKVIILLLLAIVYIGCTANIDNTLKGKSEGPVMKRYLHYCSYEIWDVFKENIDYEFNLKHKATVYLDELPKTDKIDELINIDVSKHKSELIKEQRYKYFSEVQKKKIIVGGLPAILVSYTFNTSSIKGENRFDEFLKSVEICYIMLKDKTVRIKIKGYTELFVKVRSEFEEFYMSYKPDQSQELKTNYGSFKWITGLKDESEIKYLVTDHSTGMVVYEIVISYVDEEGKKEVNSILDTSSLAIAVSNGSITAKKSKNETFKVDGHKIQYDEFYADLGNEGIAKRGNVRIYDFSTGIDISIDENISGNFDKYRNELNAFIKSIKFYPEYVKKD